MVVGEPREIGRAGHIHLAIDYIIYDLASYNIARTAATMGVAKL